MDQFGRLSERGGTQKGGGGVPSEKGGGGGFKPGRKLCDVVVLKIHKVANLIIRGRSQSCPVPESRSS